MTRPSLRRPYIADEDLSDDEGSGPTPDEFTEDDSSAIGVSIGRAQTRLLHTHVLQPGVHTAIYDGGLSSQSTPSYNGLENGRQTRNDDTTSLKTARHSSSASPSLPSPWQADITAGWSIDEAIGSSQSVRRARERAATSPNGAFVSDASIRRFVGSLSSLPKLVAAPRQSLNNAFSWFAPQDGHERQLQILSDEPQIDTSGSSSDQTQSQSLNEPILTSKEHNHASPAVQSESVPFLRRSASDGSLELHRTLSKASSLGDDTRWIDVHKQVNSRMKAIRDSWQDSNIRLPKLPELPHIPDLPRLPELGSISFSSSLLDFQAPRKRSSTLPDMTQQTDMPTFTNPNAPNSRGSALTSKTTAATHPNFAKALNSLTGDVVVLGGYRGSVLRSAEPPNRQYWVPIKVGLNLRKVNLEVGLHDKDEAEMENTIIPSGMLKNIGPVDISRRLFKRLRASDNARNGSLRVWDFGYDWRLSPHLLSRKFATFLESLPCNEPGVPAHARGATIIAHSLGGLITRHVISKQPELCRGVVYAGVPQTCVNILGPLRNGDSVLLSSKVLTAQVNFTIRTTFALLPLDGKCFFNRDTGEDFRVDFFDPKTWDIHRLSPCISRPLPSPQMETRDAPSNPTLTLPNFRGSISTVFSSVSSLSQRRRSSSGKRDNSSSSVSAQKEQDQVPTISTEKLHGTPLTTLQPQMESTPHDATINPSTIVTISKPEARAYLERTLLEVKAFKEELAPISALTRERRYPPASVMYGKSVPTVCGAHVTSPDHIKYTDAYDDLAFASGDGVVLAKAAMLPEGYEVARGGVVSSDRGHITLLGDLEAVGQGLLAVIAERRRRRREQGGT
ncbi:MAG: hypothetical protein M1828_005113 [Chrysothrix sp. TS-e1954]|nr:MAG: hypothetical protein M1828_005113 [Chrysothrix sp. TS-e1954]